MGLVSIDEDALRRVVEQWCEEAFERRGPHRAPPREVTPQPEVAHDAIPEMLDVKGAARFLRMSPQWVYQAWARDEIPGHKHGRSLRFELEELRAYSRGQWKPPIRVLPLPPPRRGRPEKE